MLRCALEARIADQDQLSSAFLGGDRGQTHPDPGHRPKVAADIAQIAEDHQSGGAIPTDLLRLPMPLCLGIKMLEQLCPISKPSAAELAAKPLMRRFPRCRVLLPSP